MGNNPFHCCKPVKQGPSTRIITPNHKYQPDDLTNPNLKFADNHVKTTKYTILTFIPLNLWEQFHRFANVYFVFIVILNFMPEVSAFAKEVAPFPVLFVLAVTAVKDAYEDYRRYRADKLVNNKKVLVYDNQHQEYRHRLWAEVKPGDIVSLAANDVIPADILLLHTSDEAGICYIETSNLDGETNLKQREVMRGMDLKVNDNYASSSRRKSDVKHFNPQSFTYDVEVELPNTEIYKFDGNVKLDSPHGTVPIRKENLILRGCILKNTDAIHGVVVYAGRETKAMMNNKGPRFKRSKLERQINRDVIYCVVILIVLCLLCAIGSGVWLNSFVKRDRVEFLVLGDSTISTPVMQAFINFWTYIILFQAMIPLPLYVTIEFTKLGQTMYINNDLDLYDDKRDLPAECRALNITEDLGQIQYIFSDKTGTLTENKMEFRRCSIFGLDYEYHDSDADVVANNDEEAKPTAPSSQSIESSKPILPKHSREMGSIDEPVSQLERMNTDETTLSSHDNPTTMTAIKMDTLKENLEDFSLSKPLGSPEQGPTALRQFFFCLAICNSVVLSLNKYQENPETDNVEKKKSKKLRGLFSSKRESNGDVSARGSLRKNESFPAIGKRPNQLDVPNLAADFSVDSIKNDFGRPDIKVSGDDGNDQSQFFNTVEDENDLSFRLKKKGKRKKKKRKHKLNSQSLQEDQFPNDVESNNGLPPLLATNLELHNRLRPSVDRSDTGSMSNVTVTSIGGPEPCKYSDSQLMSSYVSESPDELALVKTACQFGIKLVQRGPEFCVLWLPADGHCKIDVLHVLPFDSDRKRMSVIVRMPGDGSIVLLTKGADSAIMSRLKSNENDNHKDSDSSRIQLNTELHLTNYSVQGLRTLCIAIRPLSNQEYEDWLVGYRKAETQILGRDEAISKTIDVIERDLFLLGATGIEDRLQEGVADSIASFREAGINVWVLTGDKQETAINISHSARLITELQEKIILNADSKPECRHKVDKALERIEKYYPPEYQIRQRRERPAIRDDLALIIDGHTLKFCLDEDLKFDFLLLAEQCNSVVVCRATPHQKADVVRLIKENLEMQTLAIGDGANDVYMIQTADIGIGLSGQEGMQAVMAADFSLAQFRYLKKLVLVHGHWCYERLARSSLYLFYKDTIYIMMLFWFQLFNGFSGQVNIGQLYQLCFNLTMTGLPPIIMGILDRHLRQDILLANPILYTDAQNCRSYLPWHFWFNILDAVWQSLVVYFVPHMTIMNGEMGIWSFGDIVNSAGVITCVAHCALEVRGWTGLHWFAVLGSPIFAWLGFAMIYNIICVTCLHPENPYYVIIRGLTTYEFWLPQLLVPFLALMPRICTRALRNSIFPNVTTMAMKLQNKPEHLDDPKLPELEVLRPKSFTKRDSTEWTPSPSHSSPSSKLTRPKSASAADRPKHHNDVTSVVGGHSKVSLKHRRTKSIGGAMALPDSPINGTITSVC